MSIIVKLHGTSGSGKTTVARGLMDLAISPVRPILSVRGKPEAYQMQLPDVHSPLFILGPYTATCGGLDGISDADDHIRLLQQSAHYGHVFYEGLLGSEYYGRIGQASEQYGDSHIFAFLDTPIETCIERVKARRAAAGNTKPLNEDNTRGRIKKIQRLKDRLDGELHRRTVWIDHKNAVQEVLKLFKW